VAASVEELVFDLSLDSLSQQRDVLKDVRARSATLLTASSIVTSFLGGRAIDAVGLTAVTGAAVAAFLLTLLPAVYLASTTGETRLLIEGPRLYSELASAEASLEETYMHSPTRSMPCDKRTVWSSTARCGRFASGSPRWLPR
jgi:hypothetical protein